MARIFVVLGTVSIVLLAVTFALGLRIGDWNKANRELMALRQKMSEDAGRTESSHDVPQELAEFQRQHRAILSRRTTHFMVALLTSLFVLFVNSISITYFIGTGRWCKEVATTYGLDAGLVEQSLALKRHAFPWAMAAIVAVLATASLGAAADTDSRFPGLWALPHYIGALVTMGAVVWAFFVQTADIRRNTEIVEQVLDQVRQIREEKGLSVEGS